MKILKTFDSTGTVNTYVGGILNDETPHFRGAGIGHYINVNLMQITCVIHTLMHAFPLTFFLNILATLGVLKIYRRRAYFQLFVIDPRVSM